MILVSGQRGCGKTTRLIKWSAKTGGWIFTLNYERKKFIEMRIHELGLQGKAHVFCKGDVVNNNVMGKPPRGTEVSIDEFQDFLREIIPQYEINEITHSIEKKITLRKKKNKNRANQE